MNDRLLINNEYLFKIRFRKYPGSESVITGSRVGSGLFLFAHLKINMKKIGDVQALSYSNG